MTVVLTHSEESLPGLAERLRGASLTVRHAPLIRFGPPPSWVAVDDALGRLHRYHAIALTSPRAARALTRRLTAGPTAIGDRPPVWVVGPATKLAWGLPVGGEGDGTAADLAERLIRSSLGSRVLFPCGAQRLDLLPSRLRAAGIAVDEVVVYRTIMSSREVARSACADAGLIVVSSPSVARLLGAALSGRYSRPPTVAIGPTTAAALRDCGFAVEAVADAPNAMDLATAVVRYGVTPAAGATGLR